MQGGHMSETTQSPGALDELARDPGSRKDFLKKMGGGAAGATALGLFLSACGNSNSSGAGTTAATTTAAMPSHGGDVGIVNYALTLEYLEADFYRKVIA